MITSKLTTKAQTTISQPVRAALRLQADDELIYEIDDQRVILTKASRGGKTDDPFRTFHEWSSEADAKAYGKTARYIPAEAVMRKLSRRLAGARAKTRG